VTSRTRQPKPKRAARAAAAPTINLVRENAKAFAEQQQDYRAGIDAADPNNRFMRRRDGMGGIGDSHIPEMRLWYIRETSRHMCLNDDLPGQMLVRLADNIVQDVGFRLVCNTGDDVLNEELEARHAEWASDPAACDFYGERSFRELEWIVFYQTAMDGDIFGILVDDGTVQLVEADRCVTRAAKNTDRSYNGMDFDENGRVLAYNFTKVPGGPYTYSVALGDTRQILARDSEGLRQVVHSYDPRRITQHRGYPWLLPVMVKSGMLDDLQFAIVVKAQSAAAHAGIIERPAGSPNGPVKFGARDVVTAATGSGTTTTETLESIRYGQITALPAGHTFKGFTPSIPNQEHFEHVRSTIRQIGAAINMPLEMVLLDASNTNFSGWRGAMDQARMSFRRLQQSQATKFNTPIHRMNVRRWAPSMGPAARRALLDGSAYKHKWVPPAWPYINPKEDAEAAGLMIAKGLDSPRGIVAKRGGDFKDVVRETIEDRSSALRAAIDECESIEGDTGYKISPWLLLGWDQPTNSALEGQLDEQANLAAGEPSADPQPAAPKPAPAADPQPDGGAP
jgi:lambda family phage portal protein